jgi:hypothetical protein
MFSGSRGIVLWSYDYRGVTNVGGMKTKDALIAPNMLVQGGSVLAVRVAYTIFWA